MADPLKTPPPKNSRLSEPPTTGQQAKLSGSKEYNTTGDINKARELTLKEVGVSILSLERMDRIYALPEWLEQRLRELNPDEALSGEAWQNLLTYFTEDGKTKSNTHEDTIYNQLIALHEHVVAECTKSGGGTGHAAARTYVSRPRQTPKSENKRNASKPDGVMSSTSASVVDASEGAETAPATPAPDADEEPAKGGAATLGRPASAVDADPAEGVAATSANADLDPTKNPSQADDSAPENDRGAASQAVAGQAQDGTPPVPEEERTLVSRETSAEENDYSWRYIMAAFEFKKENEKNFQKTMGLQNARQQVWNLQHMLWENIDRRYSLGMTIEGVEARLWLLCRSAVCASTPFRIDKASQDRMRLFRALAFFAFADDVALGRDPTMKRMADETFKVVVDKQLYHIKGKPLADLRARAPIGSGCRVYLASRVNKDVSQALPDVTYEEGEKVVIKDVWRDMHRASEHQVYTAVMDAISEVLKQRKLPENGYRSAIEYFVRISKSEEIMARTDVRDDTETILGGPGLKPIQFLKPPASARGLVKDDRLGVIMQTSGGMSMDVESSTADVFTTGASPTSRIFYRVHYRTVMENIGTPLHKVERLDTAFLALADVVHACRLMCWAEYNHRDLSPGNIIVDETTRCGRLGDLEFAKKYGSSGDGHNPRTGTPEFMAIEVGRGGVYAFTRGPLLPGDQKMPPFRHNAGHDLESIFWIAIYLLYSSLVFDLDDPSMQYEEAVNVKSQARAGQRTSLFNWNTRQAIFTSEYELFTRIGQDLEGDTTLLTAMAKMRDLHSDLKDAYRAFEKRLLGTNGIQPNTPFHELYDSFERSFKAISELLKDKQFVRIDERVPAEEGQGDTATRARNKRQKLVPVASGSKSAQR